MKKINSAAGSLLQRFRRDGRGNVAVMTGLVAVPLFAVSGIAIDYSRSTFVHSFLQAEADAAALGAAVGGATTDDMKWVTAAQDHTKSRFSSGVSDLSVTGKWLTATDFGVDASASVPVMLLVALPGYSKGMNVSVTAVARYSEPVEHYEYYTDTVISGGAETYALQYSLLETVLCDTQAACKSKIEGGILPEGANRVPLKATAACSTGKYFYYGWEDRPPEQGSSDRDYNDIRIVIGCPTVKSSGVNSVRLIK